MEYLTPMVQVLAGFAVVILAWHVDTFRIRKDGDSFEVRYRAK
jgi:hypothetical protein